jgi:hypothetical protein
MPDNLDVTDLIRAHGDRMTPEQLNWLQNFTQRWDNDVDGSPAGQGIEAQMIEEYDRWLSNNRLQPDPLANLFDDLEPDPTAVANQPALPRPNDERVYALAARYDVPPGMVRNILTEMNDPTFRPALLQEQADDGVGRFETLPVTSRRGVIHMIDDLLAEPDQAPAPQAPAQPATQLAERTPVPREIQVMAVVDLINNMEPRGIRQAEELANTYFNDTVIDGNDVTISALSGMLRNYRVGPHAAANFDVRELAARKLEALHTQSMLDAEQIVETINEAFYDDAEGPEEARTMIRRDIRLLEQNGERAWEDLVGPMIEDYPWSRNLQHHLIQYLRNMLELREGFAKGGLVKKKRKANKAKTPSVVYGASSKFTRGSLAATDSRNRLYFRIGNRCPGGSGNTKRSL